MEYRIGVLGDFSVMRGEERVTTSLRVIQRLALAFPGSVSRLELASQLWPDDPFVVSSGRLRVSLSKLRASAPGLLLESGAGLTLDPTMVSTDLAQAGEDLDDLDNEASAASELSAISRLSPLLVKKVLPMGEGSFVEAAREAWARRAEAALIRGAELAWALGSWDEARRLAQCSLHWSMKSEAVWTILFRSSRTPEDAQRSLRQFDSAVLLAKAKGWVLPERAHQEAELLRRETLPKNARPLPPEMEFSARVVSEGLERCPDLLLPLLASPTLLPLVASRPEDASGLLTKALELSSDRGPDWQRCAARAVGLRAWMDDVQGVLNLAPRVLELASDPLLRRAAWNGLAVAHSLTRRWPEAMEAIDKAASLADEMDQPFDKLSAIGNKASFLWLQGRFAEADSLYDTTLEGLQGLPAPRADIERAVALGNRAFIPVFQGRFDEGRERIDEALQFRKSRGVAVPTLLLEPCLAMLMVRSGEMAGVPSLLRKGLSECFAGPSPRYKQCSLEFAGGALAFAGLTRSAMSLWRWTRSWREKSSFPLATAEERLQSEILAVAPSGEGPELPEDTSPDKAAAWSVKLLRAKADSR